MQKTAEGLRGQPGNVTRSLVRSAQGCSAEDAAQMSKLGSGNADGTFPKALAVCGKSNFNVFFGFNSNNYLSCVESSAGISQSCASCFVDSAKYGADNCKWACFWGSWCGQSCLNCVAKKNQETSDCAGVTVPKASTC